MKGLRAFGILGNKTVNTTAPHSEPLLPVTSSSRIIRTSKSLFSLRKGSKRSHISEEDNAAFIAKRKRAKYAHVRPPPPLANELALMQFAEGGSMESNVKRLMEAQAKAAAGAGGMNAGVADVYRDGKGGIWWDEDEELEYVHLLDGVDNKRAEKQTEEVDWEHFELQQQHKGTVVTVGPLFDRRRNTSISSIESDHDPRFLLQTDENTTFTSGVPNDRVLVSPRFGGRNMSVLSLPARPRRVAPHLVRTPAHEDVGAFGEDSMLATRRSFEAALSTAPRPRGPARRRASNQTICPGQGLLIDVPLPSPLDSRHPRSASLRQEFLADSFTPPSSLPNTRTTTPNFSPRPPRRPKTAPSVLNVRSLFVRKTSQTE